MGFTKESAAAAGKKSSRNGRPNKKTEALRGRIETLLEDQWEIVLTDIKKLSGKERIDTMIKLMEYALPKLNRTEIKNITTVEELIAMTPEERRARITEIQSELALNNKKPGRA